MTKPEPEICPQCAKRIPRDAPLGLCPVCLVTTALDDATGEQIGPFVLLAELGRGGTGVVFRARHTFTQVDVALKLLAKGRFSSTQERERFCREAQAVADLHHPNIVGLHEIGEHEGQPYIAMDWIEGETLAERASHFLSDPQATSVLMGKISSAVHYAHERGLAHRDIKPSNILLDQNQEPFVTDFGLARRLTGEESLTGKGEILGTAGFLSPEMVLGSDSTSPIAADVYSLGAVMYFLLTGRPPVVGNSVSQTLYRSFHQDPIPPTTLNNAVPKALEVICLKALDGRPYRRYLSAAAFAEDLARFEAGTPVLARAPSRIRRAIRVLKLHPVGSTVGVALLIGLGLWIWLLTVSNQRVAQQKAYAESHARAHQKKSTQLLIERGWMEYDHGDPVGAMAWFLAGWRNDLSMEISPVTNLEKSRAHAARIESVSAFAPRLDFLCLHDGGLESVDFSPDGSLLLTASMDRTAKIWNVDDGLPYCAPMVHSFPVNGARFWKGVHGELRVVTFTSETSRPEDSGIVTVWECGPTPQIKWQQNTGGALQAWDIDPSGLRVVTGTQNGLVRVWDLETGQPRTPFMQHTNQVRSARFSPDRTHLLTCAWDGTAALWTAETGERIRTFAHPEWVRCAEFSPSGSFLATGADDGMIRIWAKPFVSEPIRTFVHLGRVFCLEFSPNEHLLASGSADRSAVLWDIQTGSKSTPPLEHKHNVRTVRFSPNGEWLATAGDDRVACVWGVKSGELLTAPLRHGQSVGMVAFSPDGSRLATAAWDRAAHLWNLGFVLEKPQSLLTWPPTSGGPPRPGAIQFVSGPLHRAASGDLIEKVGFSQKGDIGFVITEQGIKLFNSANGKILTGPWTKIIDRAALSSDGSKIASSPSRGVVAWWDTGTGKELGRTPALDTDVLALSFAANGGMLAAGYGVLRSGTPGSNGAVQLWNAANAQPLSPLLRHPGRVDSISFHPSNEIFATACGDGWVRQWRSDGWKIVEPILKHSNRVVSVDYDPSGAWIVTGATDGAARIWNAKTGLLIPPLLRHADHVNARWSLEGRFILTWSRDHVARLWDAASGLAVTPPALHSFEVNSAAFYPKGPYFVTASQRPYLHLWQIPQGTLSISDIDSKIRLLACGQVDTNGDFQTLSPAELRRVWESEGHREHSRFGEGKP